MIQELYKDLLQSVPRFHTFTDEPHHDQETMLFPMKKYLKVYADLQCIHIHRIL